MQEIFKTIPSFPDYEVSNFGRVKTKSRKLRYIHSVTRATHFRTSVERFLKVQNNELTGYKFHQLYKNKKMHNKPIHLLVADAFLEKVNGLDVVNHKDGNKHNNVVGNLERCTDSYNHEHATKTGLVAKGDRVASSKLNDRMAYAIKWFLNKGISHSELSRAFKVSRPTVSHIAEGITWKHIELTLTDK